MRLHHKAVDTLDGFCQHWMCLVVVLSLLNPLKNDESFKSTPKLKKSNILYNQTRCILQMDFIVETNCHDGEQGMHSCFALEETNAERQKITSLLPHG